MTVTTALDDVTLTEAYAGNQSSAITLGAGGPSILVSYTSGSETSMEIKMEVSDESTPSTWYSPTTSAGVDLSQILTVSASGSYRASIPLRTDGTEVLGPLGSGERNIRISAKGTGAGSTGGTVTVKVVHNPLGGYHP